MASICSPFVEGALSLSRRAFCCWPPAHPACDCVLRWEGSETPDLSPTCLRLAWARGAMLFPATCMLLVAAVSRYWLHCHVCQDSGRVPFSSPSFALEILPSSHSLQALAATLDGTQLDANTPQVRYYHTSEVAAGIIRLFGRSCGAQRPATGTDYYGEPHAPTHARGQTGGCMYGCSALFRCTPRQLGTNQGASKRRQR